MALKTMYASKNGSPSTTLTAAITAAATTIPLTDASVLPAAPGIATIGATAEAELIIYAAKDGNTLTGVLRGVNGTIASAANPGTAVFRAYSTYDHDTFIDNINTLDTDKLSTEGDGSEVSVAFSNASRRENVVTGEALKTLFGKIGKWFADLKGGAFAEIGTAANQVAAGNHTHPAYETAIAAKQAKIDAEGLLKGDGTSVAAAEAGTDYVAPVEGKGLSSNDFTDAYKEKIDQNETGIAAKQDGITANGVLQGDGEGNITAANPRNITADGFAPLLLCRASDNIAASSDLNTEEFLHCGSYCCWSSASVESLANCPTKSVFLMYVCNPTSDNDTIGAWTYRIRKIIDLSGNEFTQGVNSRSTAGVYTWGAWKRISTTSASTTAHTMDDTSQAIAIMSGEVD
nr:MAG TPA: hypothetical protein [Caudoviricetes sp.]